MNSVRLEIPNKLNPNVYNFIVMDVMGLGELVNDVDGDGNEFIDFENGDFEIYSWWLKILSTMLKPHQENHEVFCALSKPFDMAAQLAYLYNHAVDNQLISEVPGFNRDSIEALADASNLIVGSYWEAYSQGLIAPVHDIFLSRLHFTTHSITLTLSTGDPLEYHQQERLNGNPAQSSILATGHTMPSGVPKLC